MPDGLLRRLLRRFGRLPDEASRIDAAIDVRLDPVERKLREVVARLELMERQADPRGLRRDDD